MSDFFTRCVKFHAIFDGKNTSELIANVSSTILLQPGSFPLVLNKNCDENNSYVSSLYSAYVSYPLEELDLIKDKGSKRKAKLALKMLGKVFRAIDIEKSVFIANFLISTNFYPKHFADTIISHIAGLTYKYHNDYICIRSLNESKDKELIKRLKDDGWIMIPARIVYLFDYADLEERKKKNHYKKDMKLLKETTLELCECGFGDEDYMTMQKLFEALYIEKHSIQNPHFSADFIKRAYESGLLELYSYRLDGKIVAFISILDMEGTISTPMLGYDTSLPQELGLYRLLCAKLHSVAEERQRDINFSSGAGDFKKLRGGTPTLEYTAIYASHLSLVKQAVLHVIAKITTKQMKKFFEKNELI